MRSFYYKYYIVLVLGVRLFKIPIDDLPTCTTMPTFMFADNSTCMAKHHNLYELETYVNKELNKMSINSEKTKYMIFYPKYKPVPYQTNLLLIDTYNMINLVSLHWRESLMIANHSIIYVL